MADGSVGSVFLDLVVRDTVDKQISDLGNKATASAKKSFSGIESTISSTLSKAFGKVVKIGNTIANGPARAMERAAVKLQNSTKKAFQSVSSSAASCGQKVESSIDRSFSKSVANAQAKVAELERALETVNSDLDKFAKSGITPTNSKEANALVAEQERLYERLEAAKKRLSIENQAAAQKEAAAQQKAAQAAAKAHEQSAARMKNAFSKAFSGAKKMAGGFGKAVTGIKSKLSSAGKSAGRFGTRLKSIISGALVFNLLSSALRKMTDYLGTAIGSSSQMKDALANLKGAAMTAAQPIVEMLTPALTALANGAATVLSYLTRLISFFTGKTVSSMSSAAKKIQSTAGAAKKAMASIAGFDEIQKLDSKDSFGGGGGSADVQPNFDFQGQSSFLDSVMESVKAGNWSNVGALLSKKLNSCLNSINWPSIKEKASSWISGLVEGINGFVQNLDWGSVGSTIGESINTLITSVGTFFANMDWTSLGSGIGEGISSIFTSINWEQYKQSLTEGFNGILELVSGFASGFAPLQGIDFSAATESLQDLWRSMWDLVDLVGGGLAEVYNTVLKPILKWAIEDAAPASVDVFTTAFDALSAALKPVMDGLDDLMAGLEPVITFIEDTAMVALDGLKSIFEKVGQVFAEKGEKITNIVSGIGEIISIVWTLIEPKMMYLKRLVGAVFGYIGDTISRIVSWSIDLFSGLIDFIVGIFTGDWDRAWNGIVGIFDGIVDNIKNSINAVIGFINGLISGVCEGINTIIKAMNKLKWDVPDWVPILGGKTFGFNLKTITAPQIPMLANGGVITQPTLAMMGEYSGASHNPEIVAPQSIIEQTLAKAMQGYSNDMTQCFEALLEENRQLRQVVENIEIGDTVIGRAVERHYRKKAVMTGGW